MFRIIVVLVLIALFLTAGLVGLLLAAEEFGKDPLEPTTIRPVLVALDLALPLLAALLSIWILVWLIRAIVARGATWSRLKPHFIALAVVALLRFAA